MLQPGEAETEVSAEPAQTTTGTRTASTETQGSATPTELAGIDLSRELGNLANPHPSARLKALYKIRLFVEAAFDAAEAALVQAARSANESWEQIGAVLGMTGQGAAKRFRDRL
jgi:hypothetical protein